MSHKATNWAFQQRGLRPSAWRVLVHLADRHNPDFGCFPSQQQLAHDAEVSRSGLNLLLTDLEEAGLIRREQRIDPSTKKQRSTRYILSFEADFGQEPSPENGHGKPPEPSPDSGRAVSNFPPEPCPEKPDSRVQSLDTNPVREPLREPVREDGGGGSAREPENGPGEAKDEGRTDRDRILEAMGLDHTGLTGRGGTMLGTQADMAEAARWLALPGLNITVIVAEIRAIAARNGGRKPSTFRYFTPAMERLSGAMAAPPLVPTAPSPVNPRSPTGGVDMDAIWDKVLKGIKE